MESLQTLLERWELEGAGSLPPASSDAVKCAFSKAGFNPLLDIVRLYEATGGMTGMDGGMWCLWPLAKVAAQTPSSLGPVFADFLISSWECRLHRVSNEISAVYVDYGRGVSLALAASSLEDFLDRYAREPDWLYTL